MLFATPAIDTPELAVVARIETLRSAVRHAVAERRRWTGLLRRNALARAIQGSNTIEGYTVTLDQAIAAAEQEPPQGDPENETWRAVIGYRNALTYILQLADDPHFSFSADLLRSLHFMMVSHDLSKHPGRWRPGYIGVVDEATGETVYEGPDAELVPSLMGELVSRLEEKNGETPVMMRAAMGHLNLVMVHPFKDGNGRMARALQTLVLAREGILAPEFCSIEEYLGRNTREYYAVLAGVGHGAWHPERDARPWIRFCLTAHYRQALTLLNRVHVGARLWELLSERTTAFGLPERVILALFDAAQGLPVYNARYRGTAEITLQLASRDLSALVKNGLLVPLGERRGRSYVASAVVQAIYQEARKVRRPIGDPFSLPPESEDIKLADQLTIQV